MQKAYRNLVRFALYKGNTCSVWDGEEWQIKRSTGFNEIIKAIESVEEATLKVRNAEGVVLGVALVSAYGLEPDETVIDWTCTALMEEWEEQYFKN